VFQSLKYAIIYEYEKRACQKYFSNYSYWESFLNILYILNLSTPTEGRLYEFF